MWLIFPHRPLELLDVFFSGGFSSKILYALLFPTYEFQTNGSYFDIAAVTVKTGCRLMSHFCRSRV